MGDKWPVEGTGKHNRCHKNSSLSTIILFPQLDFPQWLIIDSYAYYFKVVIIIIISDRNTHADFHRTELPHNGRFCSRACQKNNKSGRGYMTHTHKSTRPLFINTLNQNKAVTFSTTRNWPTVTESFVTWVTQNQDMFTEPWLSKMTTLISNFTWWRN